MKPIIYAIIAVTLILLGARLFLLDERTGHVLCPQGLAWTLCIYTGGDK